MYALQRLLLGISRGAWLVGSVLRHRVGLVMFVMRSARAALAQAVARALVPDDPAAARSAELPPATLQAVDALVPELAALFEARPGSQCPAACRRACLSAGSSGTVFWGSGSTVSAWWVASALCVGGVLQGAGGEIHSRAARWPRRPQADCAREL